jgi:hypothetical protein
MKNIFLTLTLLLTVSFAFAGNGKGEKVIYKSADGTIISDISQSRNSNPLDNKDALHCKTTCPDGTVYSCWLCKCSELPSCSGGRNTSPE